MFCRRAASTLLTTLCKSPLCQLSGRALQTDSLLSLGRTGLQLLPLHSQARLCAGRQLGRALGSLAGRIA